MHAKDDSKGTRTLPNFMMGSEEGPTHRAILQAHVLAEQNREPKISSTTVWAPPDMCGTITTIPLFISQG
ncbi:MAG: hypothetical protein KatS3mg106_437 [Gemmataceae bacterium]|jgi:hypothetical protein|nr:MAG: hypothetical protein KatS3mg106_437 [Gemmataceae bacterium]